MENKIKEYLDYLSVERGYSQGTIQAYNYDLNRFFQYIGKPMDKITKKDVVEYFLFLAKRGIYKKNDKVTRARHLSSINSFYRYLVKEGCIANNPADGIEAPKLDRKEASFLTEDEAACLLQTIDTNTSKKQRLRNLAIIKLFLTAGLRLSELIGIKYCDIDFKTNTLRIHRKGGKEQSLPLNIDTAGSIREYIDSQNIVSGNVFLSRKGNRISKGATAYLVKTAMIKAGICNKKLSPHTLRHSFCTSLLNKGVNIAIIQQLAGHKSLDTVRRYIHLTDKDMQEAVNRI